jgi:hypothetical protein
MGTFITADEVNEIESGCFKFVEVAGEFRFIHNTGPFSPTHSSVVLEDELDKVTGAGTIFVFPDYWRVSDEGSDTLTKRIGEYVSGGVKVQERLACLISRRQGGIR